MKRVADLTPRALSPNAAKPSAANAGAASSPAPAWIDELLGKLHAIYGMKWTNHVSGIPYEALRSTWGEALAGWTKADAKAALDRCRDTMPWPPAVPDFVAAGRSRDDMTDEQRAFYARAQEELPALPSRTWAESRADGARQARALLSELRKGLPEPETAPGESQEGREEPITPEQVERVESARRVALEALERMQQGAA